MDRVRLERRRQLGPGEQAAAVVHAALDDRSLDGELHLEQLVPGEKAGQALTPDILREVVELRVQRRGRDIEY
jgi:hypothetical protein